MALEIEQPPSEGGGVVTVPDVSVAEYQLPAGRQITVATDSAATATVEYMTADDATKYERGIGAATWTAWPLGTVSTSSTASDVALVNLAVRVTSSGGVTTLTIGTPVPAPWQSADQSTIETVPSLIVTNNATVGGTLTVTGAATLDSTLAANGHVTMGDAKNIVLNATTGTKIGTATTQKLGFWNATPIVQPSAYTQTYSTTSKTIAAATVDALTDSTTGSAGTTLAAGAGVYVLPVPITLAAITGAGDVLTNYVVGHKFKVLGVSFAVSTPVTTIDKLATLNLEIGSTNVTGGEVALTSANCATLGAVVAGAAVTAANTGTAADTLSIEAASVTAFAEGAGMLLVTLQNMDTADAVASLAAQHTKMTADTLAMKKNDNAIIDDLQAEGLLA